MSFREDFQAVVEELAGIPRIAVTHAWLGPPASDAAIAATERTLGPLPAELRAFYKEHNGAQLRWIDRESEVFRPRDAEPTITDYDDTVGIDDGADGVIVLVPVEQLAYRDAFCGDDAERYCALDRFGDEAVALRRGPRGVTTAIALGFDYNAGWDDTPFTLTDYLSLILACRGHLGRRKDLLRGRAAGRWRFPESVLRAAIPTDPAVGLRVSWQDARYLGARIRGTVLAALPGDRLQIACDLGGVLERLRRETDPVLTVDDPYEAARSAPQEFFRALTTASPAAARGLFAGIRGPSFGRTGGYRPRADGPAVPMCLSDSAFAPIAVFAPLDPREVRDGLARLARAWIPEAGSHEVLDGIFAVAEVLTVIVAGLPPPARAPLVPLADALDALLATLPKQPFPHPLAEHTAFWRR